MKSFFTSLIISAVAFMASASVQINGINFNINTSQKTASVTESDCEGAIVIPGNITYEENEFTVTAIEKNAFSRSYGLTSVNIPASIIEIGSKAFVTGNEIQIHISDLSKWCKISFGYTSRSTNGRSNYDPIADYRLYLDETEITDLVIPEDITTVATNAFSGCRSISKVIIHDEVQYLNDYVFFKCPNLKTVEFGNKLWSIGEYCFCYCKGIEKLELPQSLGTLKVGALQSMSGLTELSIPGNVYKIESGCFLNDDALSSVIFEDSNKDITLGTGQYSNQPLFVGCPLEKIYLGRNMKKSNVQNVGYSVSPFKDQKSLTTVSIGEGVTMIGGELFWGCSSLSEVNTPNSLEEIGSWAFEDCTSLPIIDGVQYAGNCALTVADKESEAYTLQPDTRFLLDGLFSGCVNLESFEMPNSINFCGDYMFSGCTNLKNVTLSPNIKRIGKDMFEYCENLKHIEIPSSITFIDSYAFSHCNSLEEITIPQSVSGLYDHAFDGCTSLKKLILQDGTESLGFGTSGYSGYGLFYDCPLEEVYIGRNCGFYHTDAYKKDYYPFYNKSTIKKLTIGKGATNIYNYEFYGCTGLENLYVMNEEPAKLESSTFSNSIYNTCNLFVPENSVAKYSSASVWKNFKNISADTSSSLQYIETQSLSIKAIYDLGGAKSNTISGLKIIQNSDGSTKKILVK